MPERDDGLEVVPARPSDLPTVLDILTEAARWLRAREIRQWPEHFPADLIAGAIDRQEVFLARCGGQVAGTLTLQWADPTTRGTVADDAAYVHRLAIHRAYAGRGLGRRLLGWAEQTAAAAGKRYLRLDCMAENPRLNRYYQEAGFVHRGEADVRGWKVSLYEKKVISR